MPSYNMDGVQIENNYTIHTANEKEPDCTCCVRVTTLSLVISVIVLVVKYGC